MSFVIGRKRASTFNDDLDPQHFVGKRMSDIFHNYGSPFPPICGFMMKRGRWNKSYKSRWFVWNDEHQAFLYAGGPQAKEKCKGVINISSECWLEQMELTKDGSTPFTINTPHRVFYLKVADPTEAQSWILTISQLIKESTQRVEDAKKRAEEEAAEKLRKKQEEALEFHEKMKAQGHELSGLAKLLKFKNDNSAMAPVAEDVAKLKEEAVKDGDEEDDEKDDDEDEEEEDDDEDSDAPEVHIRVDDTTLASDGNEAIDITRATDDEITKNVLQLPGASVPMTRDRHAYRGKSLSMKPMQALRLARTRRLSGAVSGEGFYTSSNAKVSAEKLKEINERWKQTHAGVEVKAKPQDENAAEQPKSRLKFGTVEIMVDGNEDAAAAEAAKLASPQKRLSLSWGSKPPPAAAAAAATASDDVAETTKDSTKKAKKKKNSESDDSSPKKRVKKKRVIKSPVKRTVKKRGTPTASSTKKVPSTARGSTKSTRLSTSSGGKRVPSSARGSRSSRKSPKSPSISTRKTRSPKTNAASTPDGDNSAPSLREQISERVVKEANDPKEKARAMRERGNRDKDEDEPSLAHLEAAAVMEDSIELKYVGKDMGFGLFAKRDMAENEPVFVEKKLIGVQNADNECLVCAQCMKFLGNLQDTFQLLGHLKSKPNLKFTKGVTVPAEDVIPCKKKCGELYCSNECRFLAWNQHHQLLCSGDPTNGKLLRAFYDHAQASENERFVLAAKVIASIIITMRRQKCDLETAWKPYASFSRELWWETIPPPEDLDMEEARVFTQLLINMCTSSLQLLKRALRTHKKYRKLFTLKFFGELLGMFEMNNWGMRSSNPLNEYWRKYESMEDDQKERVKKSLGRDFAHLERCARVVGEGSGLYELGGRINHSCMPNVVLSKTEGCYDDMSVVITKRAVYKGEELTMSYVNEKDPFAQRRSALSYYGFECKCQRCLKDEMLMKLSQPRIVFYYSSVSGNRQVKKETLDLQHMLDARKCKYEMVDVSLDENVHRKLEMQKGSGKNTLPQVFVDGGYRGSYAEFHQANEMAGGFHRFLYCGPLRRLSFYNPKFFSIYHDIADEEDESSDDEDIELEDEEADY